MPFIKKLGNLEGLWSTEYGVDKKCQPVSGDFNLISWHLSALAARDYAKHYYV